MEDKLKILLCEDDENLGMLLREYLQAKGFVAELCPDGEAGYKAFLKNKFDICVLDVMMPKKDGFTLAQEIRQANAEIPIIFLTAKTLKEDILEGFKIGADDYITKPFRLGDLQVRIDNIIENRKRMQRENDVQHVNIVTQKPENVVLSPEEEFLRRATECVNAHLSDSDFDRETFAQEMGASSSTLYNKLRAATGKNVSNFIRDIRMQAAYQMAQTEPGIRVSDLAYRVGFSDPKYFATCFKKEFGVQPSEFIDAQHSTTAPEK